MDGAFRRILLLGPGEEMPLEEYYAVEWAVGMVRTEGVEVSSDEYSCRLEIPMSNEYGETMRGTCDAIAPTSRILWDLKTGQMRDYRAQMAAYALASMSEHWCSNWTTVLLFCDQRQVIIAHWDVASATEEIEGIIEDAKAVHPRRSPCEYCKWCAHCETCPARTEPAADALTLAEPATDSLRFAEIMESPELLGKFLIACSILEDYRDQAKSKAKELLSAEIEVPGWALSTRKGSAVVQSDVLPEYLPHLSSSAIAELLGNITEDKLQAALSKCERAIDPAHITNTPATQYLRQTKPKKIRSKK
jgi:hypothetical protein